MNLLQFHLQSKLLKDLEVKVEVEVCSNSAGKTQKSYELNMDDRKKKFKRHRRESFGCLIWDYSHNILILSDHCWVAEFSRNCVSLLLNIQPAFRDLNSIVNCRVGYDNSCLLHADFNLYLSTVTLNWVK